MNKRCSQCGSSLQLVRKKVNWYYQIKQTSVERQTNVFNCRVCQLDHVMKGDHIDDSGWERLVVPITTNPNPTSNKRKYGDPAASPVKVYKDLSLVEKYQIQQTQRQPSQEIKSKQVPDTVKQPTNIDQKKAKGIKKAHSEYRNCGNCDFYLAAMCRTHTIKTLETDVCSRFKHYYKREVSGGSFSPR